MKEYFLHINDLGNSRIHRRCVPDGETHQSAATAFLLSQGWQPGFTWEQKTKGSSFWYLKRGNTLHDACSLQIVSERDGTEFIGAENK